MPNKNLLVVILAVEPHLNSQQALVNQRKAQGHHLVSQKMLSKILKGNKI
jgi:hypothetical protein